MFHDVGKVVRLEKPYYLPEIGDTTPLNLRHYGLMENRRRRTYAHAHTAEVQKNEKRSRAGAGDLNPGRSVVI